MKNNTIKITSIAIIIMLIMGALSSCFAAFVPLTEDNITSALEDIETVTSSAVEFDVEDSIITVTKDAKNYSFDFIESDKVFTKEITITDDFSDSELEKVRPELLSVLYGYIAASMVQGKSVSESTSYIVSEIKKMDNYVREKLVAEGEDTEDAQDESTVYNPSELLNSPLFNNILVGLATHASGDVAYSDSHTFSLKIAKSLQNKIIITLTILSNDFYSPSTASKTMSYNLTSIISGGSNDSSEGSIENSNEKNTPSESSSESSSANKATDDTVSKASKIPQTGRSYLANNVLVFSIIITFIIIIGMIAYDVRKNKRN